MYKGEIFLGARTHSEPRPPLEGHERTRVGARVPNLRRRVSEEPCARFCVRVRASVRSSFRSSVRPASGSGWRAVREAGGGQVGREGKGGASSSARLTCAGTT